MPDEKQSAAGLAGEVDAAAREIRTALDRLCLDEGRSFSRILNSVRRIFAESEIVLSKLEGGKSFHYAAKAGVLEFDEETLQRVVDAIQTLPESLIEAVDLEKHRVLALILFMVHEAIHPSQGFTDFATVDSIKKGVGYLALAQMDVTADFVAAIVGAASGPKQSDERGVFVEALVLSYLVGAHVFPPNGKPHKVQRLLGLLMSIALLQAEIDGRLNREAISPDWTAMVPLLGFDVEDSKVLNAMLLIEGLPLLVDGPEKLSRGLPERLWRAVDEGSPEAALACIAEALAESRIVTPAESISEIAAAV